MRAGRIVFDLPPSAVGIDRLEALYQQFEHELHGDVAQPEQASRQASVAVMNCR
jgi:hypothetical protein